MEEIRNEKKLKRKKVKMGKIETIKKWEKKEWGDTNMKNGKNKK